MESTNKLGEQKVKMCAEIIGGVVTQAFMGGAGFPQNVAICIVKGDRDGIWFVHLKKKKAIQFIDHGKVKIHRIKDQYERFVLKPDINEDDVVEYMDGEELSAFRQALTADLT